MRIRAALVLIPLLAACATKPSPAPAPPPVPPPVPTAEEFSKNGPAVVATADVVLNDSSRKRDLSVRVAYPDGAGPFPVIVFSHGFGGAGKTYDALARFWATRGFVVLMPDHADSGSPAGKDPAAESVREPAGDSVTDPKSWELRARDLAFVVAATAAVEARIPALKGKLDERHVGVGGQSYGAFSALLLGGITVEAAKKERNFADPIPKAFLVISPPGKGQQGLTDKSWAGLDRPLLVVTGERDQGSKNQDPSWRLDAYQLSPPGGKYALFLEGASHLSLTGLAAEPGAVLPPAAGKKAISPEAEVQIFRDVRIATVAFWEAYLKDAANAKAFLQSDALMTESGGRAQLLHR